jgi:Rieske Fe-S protein
MADNSHRDPKRTPNGDSESRWRQDFPIQSGEDSYATRREFTKFLGLTSVAFVFGTFVAAARKIWKHWVGTSSEARSVAGLSEIDIGGYKLFRYPTQDDPCILLRLGTNEFTAFNQNCSHLACPVHFDSQAGQLLCPCHVGVFSAEDGRALAGPPRRRLEVLNVEVHDAQVWVEGFEETST